MWTSRKYIGKPISIKNLSESEPFQTKICICPNCLHGEIEVSGHKAICLNCGEKLDLEDFFADADGVVTVNAFGQVEITYTLLA